MFPTIRAAGDGLTRDGWTRWTDWIWWKTVSGRKVWVEIESEGYGYTPRMVPEDEVREDMK